MNQRLQSITNFSDELAAPVLTAQDLRDTTVRRSNRVLKIATKASLLLLGAVSMAAVAVFLISASKPALSPADIIQMEGYEPYLVQPDAAASDLTSSAGTDTGNRFTDIREIPARVAPMAKVIPAEIVESHFPPPQTDSGHQSFQPHGAALPRMQARKQWSNLRARPTGSATILASLRVSQTVTVLEQNGEWLKVRTEFGEPVTGYMHHSVLGALQ